MVSGIKARVQGVAGAAGAQRAALCYSGSAVREHLELSQFGCPQHKLKAVPFPSTTQQQTEGAKSLQVCLGNLQVYLHKPFLS